MYNILLAALTSVSFLCFFTIKRIFFHPLANIPGPISLAITTLTEAWIDLFHGKSHQFYFELERLHDQYGPILRIGPSEVHIRDATWTRLNMAGQRDVRNKHRSLASIIGTDSGSFSTVDHYKHRVRRAAVAPIFTRRGVASMEAKMKASIEKLCNQLDRIHEASGTGALWNVRVSFLAWQADSLSTCVFEKSLDLMSDEQRAQEYFGVFEGLRVVYPYLRQFPWIMTLIFMLPMSGLRLVVPHLAPLLAVYYDMADRAKSAFETYEKSEQTSKDDPDHHSIPYFFRTVLESKLPEEDKSYDRVAHEAFEIFLAGTSTVSKVLSVATYHILANPPVLSRLKEELKLIMLDPGVIPDLKSLHASKYLVALVKEALRIGSVVAFRTPMTAPSDLIYGEYRLPAGTAISSTYSFAMGNAEVYPDPNSYCPERWLESSPAELLEMERNLLAFGQGSRNCVGAELAMAQMLLAIAVIFRRYDLELVNAVRERDVDNACMWLASDPSLESPGLFVRVTKSWKDVKIDGPSSALYSKVPYKKAGLKTVA